jgi:CheY-like chemotaxis protein/glycine cleavage system H lipoate-binding protein
MEATAMSESPNILVIEDEIETLKSCENILKKAGFSATGTDSLQNVDLTAFEVVFIDLQMAGRKGLNLLDEIKERQPCIEVIGITRDQTLEDAKAAVKYGAFNVVFKPLIPSHVTEALSQALERKEWCICFAGPERRSDPTAPTWLEYDGDGQVSIGLERGFLEATGTPIYVELPLDQARIARGETLFRILMEDGQIHELSSPLSGRVLRVNEALLCDVDQIRQVGWVVRLQLLKGTVSPSFKE